MAGGFSNGAASAAGVGVGGGDILTRIHDALKIVHSPYSTNQSRQEAQGFLEEVKALRDAPQHGFTLASDRSQAPTVRHYGLSLLEHAVKHKWAEYTEEEARYLRGWVLQLSEQISKDDPSYVRAKIAQLWVEVAKRCWGADWMDMDDMLFRLWQVPDSPVHQEFVLQVLEILSDEIFSGEDAVVAVREGALSKGCVEIFTPAPVLLQMFPNRQVVTNIRCGDEGWLNRVTQLISECLKADLERSEDIRACAIRALAVLNTAIPWAVPKAIHVCGCRPVICNALAAPNVAVQKAALEVLHTIYSRSGFANDEFLELVVPMYDSAFVDLCRRLFEWSTVNAQDIDDDKYQFAKKFSEMMSCLGNYLDRKFTAIPPETNVQGFMELLILVVQSQSLVVSIPALVTWTRILSNKSLGPAAANTPLIVPLLEVCSSRLIRYESLPEDTEDPTYVFLLEDTDTIPERHAFLGNYRRYSVQVIESIVQLKLSDSLSYILNQAESAFQTLYDGQPPLNPVTYSRNSMPVLRVDAHATVIEAALKGYAKWRFVHSHTPEDQQTIATMEGHFEEWCNRLSKMKVEDPLIRKRILQLLVAFSTTALDKNAGFMLRVLEHILMTWPQLQQEEYKMFNEAIRELQNESMVELQRLASKMPDYLLEVYDQLESKIKEMVASGTLDEKRQIGYQAFLFIIVHRATRLDPSTQLARLTNFINPVKEQWKDNTLKQSLTSFDGFCQLMGLDKAQKYLAQRRIHEIGDWGSVELDAEGLALQAELEQRQVILPLRSTKSFLTYSVEKLEKSSAPYRLSCTLWEDGFPAILPELLRLLSYAHACHDPKNWSLLPTEMQPVVGRVLTDRFWQAGISEGSKDDFYARVSDKKKTLEGFASTVRSSVRFVRETCYAIIYCMSRLDVQFYGFVELPGPLANSLFADSFCLSAHQIINLLNLVRYLVDHCPVELREHFLPPILATCFQQMDAKITMEWEKLGSREAVQATGDELTEEMKAESILRQLTYSAVIMVADFLDPARAVPPTNLAEKPAAENGDASNASKYPSLRRFCLMQASIVVPLLVFCSHAIRMHDGRCCGVVLRIFRSIVPDITGSAATKQIIKSTHTDATLADEPFPITDETAGEIREFISTEVLKAAISSLHDTYFVDSQKDLGSLIASILENYCSLTPTPRNILLSLPNIKAEDVDQTIEYVSRPGVHSRQQRAVVLDLLKDLKGVSISEMGKLSKSLGPIRSGGSGGGGGGRKTGATRSKMAQEFMTNHPDDNTGHHGGGAGGRKSPDLEGVAGMFKEGG
ncbi:putative importin beta-related nuclear transport receptor [Diplogelasinospora grovesii]|uniref:Importin beta-related nuclear transport receptor n=1 Tax=Diplogelasinospora grovesii TaxID=303347 RepID=A0AAN6N1Y5_9PEZI|nr:putative importin beta-related nuclear transport receptor [Diplogelasinospora grovesii]